MRRPLSGAGEVRARYTREARPVADVRADAVERIELGFEELVACLEGGFARRITLAALHERKKIRLRGVSGARGVQCADQCLIFHDAYESCSARDGRRRA